MEMKLLMIKKITFFFLLGAFTIMLTTCKKYPEGGKHCGAKSRMDGTWELTKVLINELDSTNSTFYGRLVLPYTFNSGIFNNTFNAYPINSIQGISGYWKLKSGKKILWITNKDDGKNPYTAGIFGISKNSTEWDILELTNEMKLHAVQSSTGYEFVLILKKI